MKIALLLGLFAAGFVRAEAPASMPPETHQFDFWLGQWRVTTRAGTLAGTNTIESVSGGRALLENWSGAKGGTGRSLTVWNAAQKQWQQFWVDNTGGVLELAGGLDPQGRMVLSGTQPAADGKTVLNRITWTPNADGSVRQLWESSADAGATWKTAFDGLYRRVP